MTYLGNLTMWKSIILSMKRYNYIAMCSWLQIKDVASITRTIHARCKILWYGYTIHSYDNVYLVVVFQNVIQMSNSPQPIGSFRKWRVTA